MSKLLERLDGVLGLTYPFDDADIAYEFSKAYPKLRAVVEAHKALLDYCDSRFTWSAKPDEWEYLSDEVALKDAFNALAALEEDL